MNNEIRAAIVSRLADELSERGSWSGETHLQKGVYLLQEALRVPLGYEFIFYKHGPFSFDLRAELNDFRGLGWISLEPRPVPYGPTLVPTNQGRELWEAYSKSSKSTLKKINDVADVFSDRGVADLEKLATAFYVIKKFGKVEGIDLPKKMSELKPHISIKEARDAIKEIDQFIQDSAS